MVYERGYERVVDSLVERFGDGNGREQEIRDFCENYRRNLESKTKEGFKQNIPSLVYGKAIRKFSKTLESLNSC
jgi:hypothetical protein